MLRAPTVALADRLCRPQRIGVFGYRGVGKTTLITVLYREAVGGRLPELRLAAADSRTAQYLSDKILQLESGQPLPATLAETDLRFHLYGHGARLELLLKDYQGEHVALGRDEPIRDFLRDCDAVWLCLDAGTLTASAERLHRQQEVEQLMEDYLALEPQQTMERPVALVLTKADLLQVAGEKGQWVEGLGMTRHALRTHCPNSGVFAVSSLAALSGPACERSGDQPNQAEPGRPTGLAEPLAWLTTALQRQDEARMERLWSEARGNLALLGRCVACFARRYPDAPAAAAYRQRLRVLRWQRRRRLALAGIATAACLLIALWSYDAVGQQRVTRFEAEHPNDPGATLAEWKLFQARHPARHLLYPAAAHAEEEHLLALRHDIHQRACAARLAELRRGAADPDANPEEVWKQYETFHNQYPEVSLEGDLQQLRANVKARRDAQVARRAQAACDDLVAAEQRTSDLPGLVTRAERFLHEFPGSVPEKEVRRRRTTYLHRLDEQDIAVARDYSAGHPLNYQTRSEQYRRYLSKHPGGGAFTREAEEALKTIETAWDQSDFRSVRDHFTAHPGDIPELVARCRTYLAVHPHGRFTAAAADLLRWSERVTAPGEYRVVLRSGNFAKDVARFFSRGPKLSVELEVDGVRHGPSTIVYNRYDPDWDYEFPRRIRWKLGQSVHIWVTEHSWKDRVVMDVSSPDGDPLAMRMLMGEVTSGPNRLVFETDFVMPALPKIE